MKISTRTAGLLLVSALAFAGSAFAQGGGRGGRGAAAPSGAAGPAAPQLAGGRFKVYPTDASTRGNTAYNTNCGYCHGDRAKGGKAGPDLITSDVTLHDDDGVGLTAYLKTDAHQKAVKIDLPQPTLYDIAAYLHARVIVAATRQGQTVNNEAVLASGDARAGQAYFNGAGGCNKCHQPDGNLKGIGAKYDASTLQDRIVNPRGGGRGGFGGRGGGGPVAPDPNAITTTVTLPNGQSFTGIALRATDFDVTLRFPDGSTQTWTRENGIPKVDRHDPLQAHVDIMLKLKDKDMHDLTAYLATLK